MSNKDCKKYRELIMEMMDGEIAPNNKIQLDIHLNSCKDCFIYLKKMEKIKRATNSLIYDIPPFMEEKIMLKITGKEYRQPVFVFNFGRALAYAVSFCLVLFISIFLIYNKFDNKIVKLSDMPVNTGIQMSEQAKNIASPQKIDKSIDIQPQITRKDINGINEQKIIQEPVNQEKDLKIALNSSGIRDEKTHIKPQQDYNVKKIDDMNTGLSAAKVTPVPSLPYNPLLAQDKAIVANNVINPLKGDKAIIRFVVDDTAFVKIVIYDKNIRPVSKILNEERTRGTYEATWEGKSDNNEIVSEGVYFVYIQIGTRVIKKSIIVNK